MTVYPEPAPAEIRCVLPVGAGRQVLSAWPGLRIAPSGAAWIDPQAAASTLSALRELGATHLVALCETADLPPKAIAMLRQWSLGQGIRLVHAPVRDYSAPNDRFLRLWRVLGPLLHRQLEGGMAVGLTCSFGAGRSGTIAALLLHEQGCPMRAAILKVRAGFHLAIESAVQERWLMERASGRPDAGRD